MKGSCVLARSFALCSEDATTAAEAASAAETRSLAENPDFAADLGAIGEDGVLTVWADLTAAGDLAGPAGGMGMLGLNGGLTDGAFGDLTQAPKATGTQSTGPESPLRGHAAAALRFAGSNLEVVGHESGATGTGAATTTPTSVGALPADTVAAVGMSGLGDRMEASWPEIVDGLRSTMGPRQTTSMIKSLEDELGVSIPGDISTTVGNDLTVAYGGQDGREPKIAVRTDADADLLHRFIDMTGSSGAVTVVDGTDRTVVGTDRAYAAAVAKGSGLGGTDAFTNAVPDAENAQLVAFVNVGSLLKQPGLGISATDRKEYAFIEAIGLSATSTDDAVDFRLRLTTR